MNPILYRYKDTESVIKVMDGYTPGEGWSPLYGSDEVKAATAAALEATAPDERVKELETELAATETVITEYRQQCLDNAAEIARLRAAPATAPDELEQHRKDAERYRWLRDEWIDYKPAGYDGRNVGRFDLVLDYPERDLDTALDAAMKEQS